MPLKDMPRPVTDAENTLNWEWLKNIRGTQVAFGTPVNSTDPADKAYVDASGGGGGAPSGPAGGALAGTYPNPDLAAALAGNGLAFATNVLSVNVDGSTIEIVSDTLQVKDGGITSAKILDGTIVAGDASTASAAQLSGANGAGSATSLVRSDHDHAWGVPRTISTGSFTVPTGLQWLFCDPITVAGTASLVVTGNLIDVGGDRVSQAAVTAAIAAEAATRSAADTTESATRAAADTALAASIGLGAIMPKTLAGSGTLLFGGTGSFGGSGIFGDTTQNFTIPEDKQGLFQEPINVAGASNLSILGNLIDDPAQDRVPEAINSNEVFDVPRNSQLLFANPLSVNGSGQLVVSGNLVDVGRRPPKDFGIVTSLPPSSSASVGDHCTYNADNANGVFWDLVYDGSGAFPWKFVGGAPLRAIVDTSESTASAAYTALATAGPSVTVPLAGDYDVSIGSRLGSLAAAASGFHSFDVGATGAVDGDGIQWAEGSAVTSTAAGSYVRRKTSLAASTALVSKYKATAGTVFFANRFMHVQPVRVG